MTDSRFIKSIRLRNLLSFGPDSEEFELKPLNVLIGPNASGKSNFIDIIGIFKYLPRDLNIPFREGGGSTEWLWKGSSLNKMVEISSILSLQIEKEIIELRHCLTFNILVDHITIDREEITNSYTTSIDDFIFRFENGKIQTKFKKRKSRTEELADLLQKQVIAVKYNQSIISQLKDPTSYPEITRIGELFNSIVIYDNIPTGRDSILRIPQKTDWPNDFLLENYDNFSLIIHDLIARRETKDILIDKLKEFYHDVDYITTKIIGGTVQVFIYEKGLNKPIPSTRLSDGTLRYICLLAILLHPDPPPLICIEEPEIGLHPDIMPTIAELLIEASRRTQLIVTTHSDVLVSALSETPESVVICEHDEKGTHFRRLDKEKLKSWLEKYSLGELWRMGEIGGTRW